MYTELSFASIPPHARKLIAAHHYNNTVAFLRRAGLDAMYKHHDFCGRIWHEVNVLRMDPTEAKKKINEDEKRFEEFQEKILATVEQAGKAAALLYGAKPVVLVE